MNGTAHDDALDRLLGRKPHSPQRRWRWVLASAAGLVLIIGLGMLFGHPGVAEHFATVPLMQRDIAITVTATGNLQPRRQVEVGSETSGILSAVYVDNNDQVIKGQPIAQFDDERLKDALAEAAANVDNAKAQVVAARASFVQSRARLARLREVRRLSAGKVPSASELEEGTAQSQRDKAQVTTAEAGVALAQAQLSSASTNLRKATIHSPVTGVVLQRHVDPGQTVAASFQTPTLFTLADDLSKMRLDVKVDEADIGQVASNQPAHFTVDAYPGIDFPAIVERVDDGATTASGSTGNEVVSYIARLDVTNVDGRLRPGMTATATIDVERISKALVVPLAAMRFMPPPKKKSNRQLTIRPPDQDVKSVQETQISRGSQQRIYVEDPDGTLRDLSVSILAIAGSDAAVSGPGLRPGMRVVTGLLASQP